MPFISAPLIHILSLLLSFSCDKREAHVQIGETHTLANGILDRRYKITGFVLHATLGTTPQRLVRDISHHFPFRVGLSYTAYSLLVQPHTQSFDLLQLRT